MRTALFFALLAAGPAVAQSVATSPEPNRVAVTIYRATGRPADVPLDLSWLTGFALVTEIRQVDVPAGEGEIRFEGVAGGIIPESAIVTGLPEGVIEKNQDAALLSPGSLLDRSLGRRVHLRRTSEATGKVMEEEAIIRSGAGGAVVLQTPAGFEALRCTGLDETIVYPEVPRGLSAKPTLSVRTRSSRAVSTTVTLSYLATGFDWQANYVAKLRPDGRHADLFAWITLASSDETSFTDADTKAVAGRLNRVEDDSERSPPRGQPLTLRCWPAGTTHGRHGMFDVPPAPSPPPPPAAEMDSPIPVTVLNSQSIVVTGSRIPRREDLGDLKLYSLPERVTVAANSQKQVAMIDQPGVAVELLYRSEVAGEQTRQPRLLLRTHNKKEWGLGLPLPAGSFVLFDEHRGRAILLGEGTTDDKAVGEKTEIELGEASNVTIDTDSKGTGKGRKTVIVTATNDEQRPVAFEAKLLGYAGKMSGFSEKVFADGQDRIWRVELPANSSRTLRYTLREND